MKYCPLKNGPALYLDCRECEQKKCKETEKFEQLVLGYGKYSDVYGFKKKEEK